MKYPLTTICQALGVSRSGYVNHLKNAAQKDHDQEELKKKIEDVILDFPGYGYRRVTRELGKRGMLINHKRILKVMRKNNLLCKKKRRFVNTTDSDHGFKIYPNLIRNLVINRINQVWVADITYVRLPTGFCYLSVILDAFSRKVVGWNLGLDLSENLVTKSLIMAINTRGLIPGLIHHSDRGVQYASLFYTKLLWKNGIQISMSAKGNPYDNARAESFMKTIKREEVYLEDYENFFEARARIAKFINEVYNQKRLHSSLNYQSPEEFEKSLFNNRISVLN